MPFAKWERGEAFGEQLRARNQSAETWIFIESNGMLVLPRGMKLLMAWFMPERWWWLAPALIWLVNSNIICSGSVDVANCGAKAYNFKVLPAPDLPAMGPN